MAMLTKPGTPTLRMSANNSQRGVTPRKFSRTIARERRYQIITALPPANGITSPQPAPAGPSAGKGPKPKMSAGEMAMCTTTQPTSTAAGKLMLHAAIGRLQDDHHPWKCQRVAGEGIGTDAPEKETIE